MMTSKQEALEKARKAKAEKSEFDILRCEPGTAINGYGEEVELDARGAKPRCGSRTSVVVMEGTLSYCPTCGLLMKKVGTKWLKKR